MDAIEPIDRHAIETRLADWRGTIATLASFEPETPAQEAWLSQVLETAQVALKATDAERTEITKPILESKRNVDEAFKPLLDVLAQVKQLCSTKLSVLAQRRLAAQQEALRLAAEAASDGNMEAASEALVAAQPAERVSASRETEGWDFEVVDFAKLDDSYKLVDDKALKALCKAHAKKTQPPKVDGVVFKRTVSVTAAGKRGRK